MHDIMSVMLTAVVNVVVSVLVSRFVFMLQMLSMALVLTMFAVNSVFTLINWVGSFWGAFYPPSGRHVVCLFRC